MPPMFPKHRQQLKIEPEPAEQFERLLRVMDRIARTLEALDTKVNALIVRDGDGRESLRTVQP